MSMMGRKDLNYIGTFFLFLFWIDLVAVNCNVIAIPSANSRSSGHMAHGSGGT